MTIASPRQSIGTAEQAYTPWDATVKPVPKRFLWSVRGSNICVTGVCSDSNGLVTGEGRAATEIYFANTGEGLLTTLSKWMTHYGFPPRRLRETLDEYRTRLGAVIYYNKYELGLGREMACSSVQINPPNGQGSGENIRVGCFVTNYGTRFNDNTIEAGELRALLHAAQGVNVKNTVVISYDSTRPADHKVQFNAFGEHGERLDAAQLDYMGARHIPSVCMQCHGGTWNQQTTGVWLAKSAHFLPLNPDVVDWMQSGAYTKSAMDTRVRNINDLAFAGTGATFEAKINMGKATINLLQRNYMRSFYQTLTYDTGNPAYPSHETLTAIRSPGADGYRPAMQFTGRSNLGVSWDSSNARRKFFHEVINPFCGTCHWALGDSAVPMVAGDGATCTQACHGSPAQLEPVDSMSGSMSALLALAVPGMDSVIGAPATTDLDESTFLEEVGFTYAVSGTGYTIAPSATASTTAPSVRNTAYSMPHAQPALARFWGEARGGYASAAEYMAAYYRKGNPGFGFLDGYADKPIVSYSMAVPNGMKCSVDADCGMPVGAGMVMNFGVYDPPSASKSSGRYCEPTTKTCGDKASTSSSARCPGELPGGYFDTYGTPNMDPTVSESSYYFRGTMRDNREGNSLESGFCAACGQIGQPKCPLAPACHEGFEDPATGYCVDRNLIYALPQTAITIIGSPSTAWGNLTDLPGTNTLFSIGPTTGTALIRIDLAKNTPMALEKAITRINFKLPTTCTTRMTNATVRIYDARNNLVFEENMGTNPGGTFTRDFTQGAMSRKPYGRYVQVQANNDVSPSCGGSTGKLLQLIDLEVRGFDTPCPHSGFAVTDSTGGTAGCCITPNNNFGFYVRSSASSSTFSCQMVPTDLTIVNAADGKLYNYDTDTQIGTPALLNDNWANTVKMVAGGGAKRFVVLRETNGDQNLYDVTLPVGHWLRKGATNGWAGVTQLAYDNNWLYSIIGPTLRRYSTNLAGQANNPIGSVDWSSAKALVAMADTVYILTNGSSLYKVNPNDASYVRLGAAGIYSGTVAMARLDDGNLYVQVNGTIVRVNTSSGAQTIVSTSSTWSGVDKMLGYDQNLYILKNGTIYKLTLATGVITTLGIAGAWGSSSLWASNPN